MIIKPITHFFWRRGISWLSIFQLSNLAVVVTAWYQGAFSWTWLLVSLGFYFLYAVVGQSVGFHRYLTHRAFATGKFNEFVLLLLGTLAGHDSCKQWSIVHRKHHAFSDTDKDPSSPRHHSWWSIVFWFPPWSVGHLWENSDFFTDLDQNKTASFFHNWHWDIVVVWMIVLYLIDPKLLVYGFCLPSFMNFVAWGVLSWYGHQSKTKDLRNTVAYSENEEWLNLVLPGEGYHRNHHINPRNQDFTQKWWSPDLGAYVIKLLKTK